MRAAKRSAAFVAGAMVTALLGAGLAAGSSAAPAPPHPPALPAMGSDIATHPTDYYAKPRTLDRQASEPALAAARQQATARRGLVIRKVWPAVNYVTNRLYLKEYRLRGVGRHVQVWVARNRAFPRGDCRNDLHLTRITDGKVRAFIREFDRHILPIETRNFSVAPRENGSGSASLAQQFGLPMGYWKTGRRHSDDTVVLVDNVKDANFYRPRTPEGQTYIAGFFSRAYQVLFDRNIMTVDAYDWRHRTGGRPPNDTGRSTYRACGRQLGASTGRFGSPHAHAYEATFAHEYQHLLENYQDPDEALWVNEGLSDYAETLTGYINPGLPPRNPNADGHIKCFQGFEGRRFGGPENSLTQWGDQGAAEILCDYGAAYSFMQYLHDHYGRGLLTALHRADRNGIRGLQTLLDRRAKGVDALAVFHRWSATMALDAALDRNGGRLVGGPAGRYRARTLKSRINWRNPQAYNAPGAPPNGSDYVLLRDADGTSLTAHGIRSVEFAGAATLTPHPVEWTVDRTPPNVTTEATTCGTTPDGNGASALYSGCGNGLDRSVVRSVTVPAVGSATLSFDVLYDTEENWDFGFVQVSSNGGRTWTSLRTQDTTRQHDPGANPAAVAQLPGFSGDSGTWRTETADLSAYAGKDVLVGFRSITDGTVAEAGMWVRNIRVGGTTLPSGSLTGWQSTTQAHPVPVGGWTVQLLSYGTGRQPAHLTRLRLSPGFHGALRGAQVRAALGRGRTRVAAIVTADDRSERRDRPALYTLTVNGVVQPGGGRTAP